LEADLGSALVELRRAVGERDELRAQLAQRTEERDRVAADLKAFSTDLQTLVGRVETAIANGPRAGATTEAIPASRRSE
jgi:septal ring factor EnvC (AmiA/AmiB activator)